MLRKAAHDGKDPYLGLLDLRNTPIPDLNASPAELSFGRALNTKLPVHKDLLTPQSPRDIQEDLRRRQQRQKFYYNGGTVEERDISPGDVVGVQRNGKWEPAVVTGADPSPRSYTHSIRMGQHFVETDDISSPQSSHHQRLPPRNGMKNNSHMRKRQQLFRSSNDQPRAHRQPILLTEKTQATELARDASSPGRHIIMTTQSSFAKREM